MNFSYYYFYMKKLLNNLNLKQIKIGLIIGVITVTLMGGAYYFGYYQRKRYNNLDEGGNFYKNISDREVYIKIKEDCSSYSEENIIENNKIIRRYCINYIENESVFDAMKRLEEENSDFSFSYDDADFGIFVTSINSYHPDIRNNFWAFFINDKVDTESIDEYIVQKDDEISFLIEEVEL